MQHQEIWQPWFGPTGPGPTGQTGPNFLGVTGAVTGPMFFGVTGASGPTGPQRLREHVKSLYNRIRIQLVGASDAMIRSVMYDVLREFFNDSSVWKETIPGILVPGVNLFWLEPGNPQSVLDPFPRGVIIGFAGLVDFNQFALGADMPEPPVMRLQFAQDSPLPSWATVIKTVEQLRHDDLPEVPYWVVQTYEQWLMRGVIGQLQLQDDKPYSNPKLGMLNYQYFRQGVNTARVRALRRNTFGTNAWVYPQNYRVYSQRGGVSVGNPRVF